MIRKTANEVADMVIRKRDDYGTRDLEAFGEFGVLVRVTDKIERLRNLLQSGKEPKNESLDDTWQDVVGYGILGLLIRRGQLHEPEPQPNRPPIVCLCGSTRFWEEFHEANFAATLHGKIVLTIAARHQSDEDEFKALPAGEYARIKTELDLLHLEKIDLADEVTILNVDGYIGDSTRREWRYAVQKGKKISWWDPERIPEWTDGETHPGPYSHLSATDGSHSDQDARFSAVPRRIRPLGVRTVHTDD